MFPPSVSFIVSTCPAYDIGGKIVVRIVSRGEASHDVLVVGGVEFVFEDGIVLVVGVE